MQLQTSTFFFRHKCDTSGHPPMLVLVMMDFQTMTIVLGTVGNRPNKIPVRVFFKAVDIDKDARMQLARHRQGCTVL